MYHWLFKRLSKPLYKPVPEKLFPTAYALKDLKLALGLAQASGITATVAQSTATLLDAACARGYAMNYYPVIYRLLRKE